MPESEVLQGLLERMNAREQRVEQTTDIVSVFAYLIGVRKAIFDNPHQPPRQDVFGRLELQKPARIVRNLCMLRTAIERNFGRINEAMRNEYKSPLSMSEYVPADCLNQLTSDGISLYRQSNVQLNQYIIEINRLIADRINNCKTLFPTWLNWIHVRNLFIMPNGLTPEGTKAAASEFFGSLDYYPYQVYMNWPASDCGNILQNDKKFVTRLYEWNNDCFTQLNKVEDAGEYVTGSIYDFIEAGRRIVFLVDCENSDPYNLCAAITALDAQYTGKIDKLILFDDVHASSAWNILSEHISIPVEYILTERIKQNKSVVDMTLAMRVSKEFYKNGTDSFVLVSSDSDYWSVIESLPEANFLVMVEHGKCGPDIKAALDESGIFFCYIDEFHSARSESIQHDALARSLVGYIKRNLRFNFRGMFESALAEARVHMTDSEKQQYFDKHIKPFQADMDADGNLEIRLRF